MTGAGTTAVLLLDPMVGVLGRFPDAAALIDGWNSALAAARRAGLTTVVVRVAFRAGHPEVAASNRVFGAVARDGRLLEDDEATAIHPAVVVAPGDIVVTKRRISAFAGSDLDTILRARHAEELVLMGVATSGVVLSTLTEAADRDFGLTVLSDGCRDADETLHQVLVERYFPHRGHVATVADWVARAPG